MGENGRFVFFFLSRFRSILRFAIATFQLWQWIYQIGTFAARKSTCGRREHQFWTCWIRFLFANFESMEQFVPPSWPLVSWEKKRSRELGEWKAFNVSFVDWIFNQTSSFICQLERAIGQWADGYDLHSSAAINCGIQLEEIKSHPLIGSKLFLWFSFHPSPLLQRSNSSFRNQTVLLFWLQPWKASRPLPDLTARSLLSVITSLLVHTLDFRWKEQRDGSRARERTETVFDGRIRLFT